MPDDPTPVDTLDPSVDPPATTLTLRDGLVGFGRTLLPYLRPRRWRALAALASTLPQILFLSGYPLLLAMLIDRGILPRNVTVSAATIAALVGLLVLTAIGDLFTQYLSARVAAEVIADLRLHLFDHLQRLSMSFYTRTQLGDLITRFTVSLDAIEHTLALDVPLAFSQVLIMLLGTAFLFWLEWRLALLSLVLLPLLAAGPRWLGPRASRAGYVRQTEAARLAATIHENLAAQQVVKAFGLHGLFRDRLAHEASQLVQSSVRAGFLGGLLATSLTSTGYVLLVVVVAVGTYLTFQNQLTLGALVAFFELVWWIVGAVQQLSTLSDPLQRALAATQRVEELLAEQPAVADSPGARPLPPLQREIRFDSVQFSYSGDATQRVDLTLQIPRGWNVALVGPSGSGKSTFLQLLMRFYDPAAGSITFDGHDLRQHTQASVRAQMAAVLQDNVLFDSSIRENIRMGRPDATDAEIETAARAAEVHDSIVAKPQGYDTPVGERGGRLSGGERQRVAIARALIRDPAVLILDEASAALDPTTEASLNATLARLAAGRTVVSVTHRLASITHVDQIFVLQAGRVVQHGTHEQLLGEAGLYKQLWDKQSGFVLGDGLSAARVEPHRLRAIPMLAELEDHVLEELAQLLMPVSLPADRVVVQEGDPADTFYMIARGRVAVKRGETVLNILEDGDYFGEVALLGGGVRTATVTTLAASTFLACTRGAFDRLLLQSTRLDQEVRQRASMRRSR